MCPHAGGLRPSITADHDFRSQILDEFKFGSYANPSGCQTIRSRSFGLTRAMWLCCRDRLRFFNRSGYEGGSGDGLTDVLADIFQAWAAGLGESTLKNHLR